MYLNEGWIDWPETATPTKPYPEPWQQTLLEAAEYIFWNDRPKRKKAEVLNALEKAANY